MLSVDSLSGHTIKGYEFREPIGVGGFGAVYRAHQAAVGRDVAIKIILPEYANRSEFIYRFEREAQIIASLEHPHIVPLYDYWREEQITYLVLRLLHTSLASRLKQEPPSLTEVGAWMTQITAALAAAHRHGIVHRDLKPDNIRLDREGNAYLADFGIAKDLGVGTRTPTGAMVGSPTYLSPEQIRGQAITARTDIYSLGLILYEMLAGEQAFSSELTITTLIYKHLNEPVPFLVDKRADVSYKFDQIIQKATAKEPTDRHPDVQSLMQELHAALQSADTADDQLGEIVFITQAIDYASMETAYLDGIIHEHGRWGKLYTEIGGQTRDIVPAKKLRTATVPIVDDIDALDELEKLMQDVDISFAKHKLPNFSANDDAAKVPLETFDALTMAYQEHPRMALIGEPGSGKTTTLRRIALNLAAAFKHDESGQSPLPLFVPLGAYTGGSLESYLESRFSGLPLDRYLPDRLAVLLDGLNETPAEHIPEIQRWLNANPDVKVIVSCRKLDYVERKLNLARVDIQPLDVRRILQFMTNWGMSESARDELLWGLAGEEVKTQFEQFQKAGNTFEQFWGLIPPRKASNRNGFASWEDRMRNFKSARDLMANIYHLIIDDNRTIDDPDFTLDYGGWNNSSRLPGLLGLMTNPFLLTLTIAIYNRRKTLPRNRGELFGNYVAGLLSQRGKLAVTRERPWIDETIQRQGYAALATYLQAEKAQTFATFSETEQIFAGACPGVNVRHLVDFAISANILERSQDALRFSHQLLQEYFAAFGMLDGIKHGISAHEYFAAENWWEPSKWDQTTVLLVGMGVSQQIPLDPWHVIEWLTPINPIVAWRCITENDLDQEHPSALALMEPRPGVRAAPLARFKWSITYADRDHRPGVGVRSADGLPDLVWCEVPAGEFIYQRGERLSLPTFYITKYPITYSQFQCFIDSEDGYTQPSWWEDLPRKEFQPAEQSFKYANHPRERVSLYEAVAFCRWLSTKLGCEITLPTEQQWEKAARGTDGRPYSYEGKFDKTRGNTKETGFNQTSAVGLFLDGISPYGLLDMTGNVSEWTDSFFKFRPTDTSVSQSPVTRGGSWTDHMTVAKITYRRFNSADYRDYTIGFRVASMQACPS